jgi:hypothetical protein
VVRLSRCTVLAKPPGVASIAIFVLADENYIPKAASVVLIDKAVDIK